jgi:hypothetical protein
MVNETIEDELAEALNYKLVAVLKGKVSPLVRKKTIQLTILLQSPFLIGGVQIVPTIMVKSNTYNCKCKTIYALRIRRS